MDRIKRFLFILALVQTAACTAADPSAQPLPTLSATSAAMLPIPTLESSATPPPTSTAVPTLTPAPTATIPPTATPHPLFPFTLAGLRSGVYLRSPIRVREVRADTAAFTHTYIDYTSDGLTITGMMHTPKGKGPFPVVILLHGFHPRDTYWSGWGTWQAAEFFAQNGYIAIAPDLRSWGESDSGLSLFQTGFVRDVLNLISSLGSLPQADPSRVGLWGHSMGGRHRHQSAGGR